MLAVTHGLSGFTIALILATTGHIKPSDINIFLAVLISVVPDIDGLWSSSLEQHHESYLHAPITWIIASSILYVSGYNALGLIVLLASGFHLFTDYLTALTTGVRLFYPFSSRDFYLFELSPEEGDFNPKKPSKKDIKSFFKLYIDQKPVLIIEVSLLFLGLFSAIILMM